MLLLQDHRGGTMGSQTMFKKSWMILVSITFMSLLFCSSAPALDSEMNRATLRGLAGVRVLVEDLAPEIEKGGLTRDKLQGQIEQKLKDAKIKILTQEECLKTPGEPYLYIILNANAIRPKGDAYAYSIDIGLIQNVMLQRNPTLKGYAITWSTGGIGSIEKEFLDRLRESVDDLVNIFVQAYLNENSKKK